MSINVSIVNSTLFSVERDRRLKAMWKATWNVLRIWHV